MRVCVWCARVCVGVRACVIYQVSLPHYTNTKFLENVSNRCVCVGVRACVPTSVSVCVRSV